MRLVLDTDVLVSGLRSSVGASRLLLVAVAEGAIRPLVSVAMVLEYEAVLMREEHMLACNLSAAEVVRFIDGFVARSSHVGVHFRTRPSVRDPNDEMFAEAAVNGHADALVSFNVGDYRPVDARSPRLAVPVLRPGDVLRRLAWRP